MPKQMKVVALCMCNRELPLSSLYGFIHFPGGWTVFGVSFLEMDSSFFFQSLQLLSVKFYVLG